MKRFKEFLNEDKAQEGEGHKLWHVSTTSHYFNKFHPMSHFGTKESSRTIGHDSYYKKTGGPKSAYAVRIKHGKSFGTEDIGHHDSSSVLSHLHIKGMFNKDEYTHHLHHMIAMKTEHEKNHHLASIIREKGYHSLHYVNKHEDKGSTSHIITHPDQVRILKTRQTVTSKFPQLRLKKPVDHHAN